MKVKKILIAAICALCASAMAVGLVACAKEEKKQPLNAPEISADGRVISWSAVENATGYEVYENDALKQTTEETSYTVTQTAGGEYAYTVKAVCADGSYPDSEASNAATIKILSAPQITLNGTKITWGAVENAASYQIYLNGERDRRYPKTTVSYTINPANLAPGTYEYTVVAMGEDGYLDSVPSNAVQYKSPLPVTVNAPADYTGKVTVEIYSGATKAGSSEVTLTDGTGTAEFDLNIGNYVVKTTVDDGYVAAWEYITAANPGATVNIIKLTEENTLVIGENTVTVPAATGEDEESFMQLVYVAQKTGTHSIVGTAGDAYTVTFNGRTVVAPASGIEIGNFEVEEGQPLVFTISGAGEHTFELADRDVPHPIKLSPYYVVNKQEEHPEVVANIITGSCTGEIEIAEEEEYTFFFTTATLGERTVTITVDGTDYVFNGEVSQQTIALKAGKNTITIKVEGENSDGLNIAMFVFNGPVYQDFPAEDNG